MTWALYSFGHPVWWSSGNMVVGAREYIGFIVKVELGGSFTNLNFYYVTQCAGWVQSLTRDQRNSEHPYYTFMLIILMALFIHMTAYLNIRASA